MLPSKICSTFCWKESTKLLFREFSTEKKLALSEKLKRNEIGSRKGSFWFGDPEGIKRGFSTSSVCSARGNRVRPAPPSEELGFADYNPVVEDFPDMKHRKPTPKLIERLQNERGDIRELVENSTNFSEAKPANLDEQWSSSPYPASEILKKERDQSKKVLRPKMDPKKTSVVLFPGQGSQFVGMGAKLLNYPNVHEIYGVASEILGYDLLDLCLKGPQENLDRTVFSQTAIYVTSIAALEKLKADYFMAVESCVATAGFSVGEYAALVFAGSLTFEDGLKLVKARAEAMQAASEAVNSGMLSVLLEHSSDLGKAMELAKLWCQEKKKISSPVCKIANFLFPEGKVIAGHSEALDFIEANAKQFKIRPLKRLAVSGAFHTPLMLQATEEFFGHLSSVTFKAPSIKIHSNVSGTAYYSASSIPKLLLRQINNPVKWEQTVHCLYERKQGTDFPQTFEVGPGRQLGAILRRNNAKAFANYTAIDV